MACRLTRPSLALMPRRRSTSPTSTGQCSTTYVIEPAVDDAYRMVAAHAAGVKPNLGAAVYARLLISRQNAEGDWDGFHQRPPSSYSRMTMASPRAASRAAVSPREPEGTGRRSGGARARLPREPHSPRHRRSEPTSCSAFGGPARRARACRILRASSRPHSVRWRMEVRQRSRERCVLDGASARGAPRWRRRRNHRRVVSARDRIPLKTQAADGTWRVASRLHPPAPLSPPYFDAGYPNGHDQFLSMQGASWAVMALSYSLGTGETCGAAGAARDRARQCRALGRDR